MGMIRSNSELVIVSKDHADQLKPKLKWLIDTTSKKEYRLQARRILAEIEGIKDWKQISITKRERQLLTAVQTAFPEESATNEGRQLQFPFPPGQRPQDRYSK
jgi:hypothetical protein